MACLFQQYVRKQKGLLVVLLLPPKKFPNRCKPGDLYIKLVNVERKKQPSRAQSALQEQDVMTPPTS